MASIGNSTVFQDNGTTHTFAHNNNGDVLLVAVFWENSRNINSVTYNGVAMTLIDTNSNENRKVSVYRLNAPAAGSNNVVVTMGGFIGEMTISAISIIDADTTDPVGGTAKTNGQSTSATLGVTVEEVGSVLLSFMVLAGISENPVATESTTIITNDDDQDTYGLTASKVTTGTGSVNVGYSWDSSERFAIIGVEIKAGAVDPPSSGFTIKTLTLMGVG